MGHLEKTGKVFFEINVCNIVLQKQAFNFLIRMNFI